MFTDYIRISLNNIRQRKMRSFLTVTGIVVGIMAVVALISIGQGLSGSVKGEFEKIGYDKIIIQGGVVTYGPPGSGSDKLTQKDLDVVRKVRGVDGATASSIKFTRIKYKKQEGVTIIYAYPDEDFADAFAGIETYEIKYGSAPGKSEKGKVCIGSRIASGKFWSDTGPEMGLRSKLTVVGEGGNEKEFTVSCIIKETGSPQDDSVVYVFMSDFVEIFNSPPDEFSVIYVKIKDGFNVDMVSDEIKKELEDSRGNDDFQVSTLGQVIETFDQVFGILNMVLIGIAAISLVVGGIGIMNTIYTSVLERTREIGVMKAIGARNSDILVIFLFEAGTLGLIGGVIGCSTGIFISKTVEVIAQQSGYSFFRALVSPELIAGSLLFSVIIGMIAGILPARQASRLKPVDALRYE
jgi:putative ABC transport system permease protein